MPANIPFLPEAIARFIERINSARQTPAEWQLQQETQALASRITPMPGAENQQVDIMRISAGQASFLTMLTEDLAEQHSERPLNALDIGTFTGSSAAAIAQGMRYGGKVITCDIHSVETEQYQAIATRYWKASGVAQAIEPILAPALETLQKLVEKEQGSFDIAFIDADKQNYDAYYELILQLLRPGGRLILDNMLWSGRVADNTITDPNTHALRTLSDKISKDQRVRFVLLGDEDGIMLVKKR